MEFNFDEQNQAAIDNFDDFFSQEFVPPGGKSLSKELVATPSDVTSRSPKRARRATRRSVGVNPTDIELVEPTRARSKKRKRAASNAITYKSHFSFRNFLANMSWIKLGWILCFALFLRLILMDRGVLDFYRNEKHLDKKVHELQLLHEDNASLVEEIHRIKTNDTYQKKMAREHLGVIANDEYLILFAQDSVPLEL